MRAIDADKMVPCESGEFNKNLSYCDEKDLYDWVKEQPTLEVEVIRHAHWEKCHLRTYLGHEWYCSNCEEHIFTRYSDYPEDRRCRWCGAVMDEEIKNGESSN